MDFQFKANTDEKCDISNDENEYNLVLSFKSLQLTNKDIKKIQLLFLYGDLLSKLDIDVPFQKKGEDGALEVEQVFVIHSTPNTLANNFQLVPLIFLFLDEDKKIIGSPIVMEVNECFANTVRCRDFKQQTLKKTCELEQSGNVVGTLSFTFTVIKQIGNSNRYRKFYTESTAEKAKSEKLADNKN